MVVRPLTEVQRRCFELRQLGWTYRDIAKAHGRSSAGTVQGHVDMARRKLGMPREATARDVLTAVSKRIIDMAEDNIHPKQIAAIVGKSPNAVRHVIRRYRNPSRRKWKMMEEKQEQEQEQTERPRRYVDAAAEEIENDTSALVSIRVPVDRW